MAETYNVSVNDLISEGGNAELLEGYKAVDNGESNNVSVEDLIGDGGNNSESLGEYKALGEGGTPPDGQGGGGSSSSVTYTGATEITTAGTYSNQTYNSSTADENSVLITASGNVVLNNATVTKTGDSDGGDNCNFYGINSAVLATGGGTVSINGGTVTASATGANGVFSYGGNGGQNGAAGDGTTIYISNTTINTTGDNAGGIMTTGGGVTVAKNLTINTTGRSSAPIRTDRGGGSVSVNGGSYTSEGLGSPAIYSTADIVVEGATLTSKLSEGVCIEGQNSVELTDCTLTVSNTQTNGNAQFLDAVILYQSQSGDAADGTSTFTMTGGTLNNTSGHLFHVTNTAAVINLNNVTINDSGDGVLLSVCDDGWSGASNVATLNASGQNLTGDILVGDDSTLTLNLTDGTVFTGSIDGNITNAKGTAISTDIGTVSVSLDDSSKWYLTEDTYVKEFSGTAANVITGNYNLYVNNVVLDGTTESEGDTDGDGLNITNSTNATLITGTANNDTITNTGERVTIQALAGDDFITNNVDSTVTAASVGSVIDAGDGNDTIYNHHTYNPTLIGGAGNDSIVVSRGSRTFIDSGEGNDTIIGRRTGEHSNDWTMGGYATIAAGAGNDYISTGYSDNSSIDAGAGSDTLIVNGEGTTIDGGAGNNLITLTTMEGGQTGQVVVFDGNTTVENFATGFGEGSDTIYIPGNPAGVTLSSDGLTFLNNTASVILSDVTTTAKVNIYHESRDVLNKGIFIAADDWYQVEDSDLTVDAGEEVYFVGTSTEANHGVDFSGVKGELNLTMDTAYIDSEDYVPGTTVWINSVYSLKGGAGNTTITGSTHSDTILAGTGETTINAAKGDDLIQLSGSSALINYAEGDGNDTIIGFDSNATLSVGDGVYSTQVSGNDLIITVGDSKLTLVDAANVTNPNIESSNAIVNLVEAILKRTAAGYPVMAGLFFNPEEITGPEPTNYSAKEDWTITSADDLELYGVHYTPEKSNDKWVVLVHGYGCTYESMNPFATFYLDNNYNVLMIDQRAAGKSEGTWLTMGAAESQDVALWTQEIARRNSNAKITLHGVSMGSATAMLTAARSDAVNVTALVEDCGYTSAMEIFYLINEAHLGFPAEVVAALDPVSYGMTGYYLHDAAPINSISSAKMPTLFISGDDDGVVPVSMLSELYDESGAEVKETFIVKGAGHARAGLNDPVGYSNSVFRFLAEANGEGWDTSNIVDDITLRGTKYNDTLENSGDNVTITAAAGDDTIINEGDNIQINYTDGDGNDTIGGFNETSTLSISGGSYTSLVSGDDVVLTVGEGAITLTGAASLDALNIIGEYEPSHDITNTVSGVLITGTNDADTIYNTGERVTIQALAGDDFITNNVDSSVTAASVGSIIDAGNGNDTIFNHHTYNPTLLGGAGNDSIAISNGHLTFADGGDGDDTISGVNIGQHSDDWTTGGRATLLGGEGNDLIDPGYSDNATINGGNGNDTIIVNGKSATIDGGAGDNLITLTTVEGGQTGQFIVLNGNTTVENFATGFGEGTDTVYIESDAPAVDFKAGGLTLYTKEASLTLADVNTTDKLNIYYAADDKTGRYVFIADDETYAVTSSDLADDGAEIYFVGATAKPNHGVDFSGITSSLNMTLDTDYGPAQPFWINNVYSVVGGAASTKITGSAKSDTITSGGGATTLNAGAGGDILTGNGKTVFNIDSGATTTVNGAAGDLLNLGDDELTFQTKGTAYIVDGALDKISGNTILKNGDEYLTGDNLRNVTIVNGDSATLTSDEKKIFVGTDGATLAGYNPNDNAFVIDPDTEFFMDDATFHAEGQKPIVLENYNTTSGTFATFVDTEGTKTLTGWSADNGGLINGSNLNRGQLLFGMSNGDSTILGGAFNDTIYAGGGDIIFTSGGADKLYIDHTWRDTATTIDLTDGAATGRTNLVKGFALATDVVKTNSTDNLKVRVLGDKLQVRKNNSVLVFDELTSYTAANGLQVQSGNEVYTLRSDYDGGLTSGDFFWQGNDEVYYRPGTTFRVKEDDDHREYFIESGSGRATVDGFTFGTDGDRINVASAGGIGYRNDDLFIASGDTDVIFIKDGAGKVVNFNVNGTDYVAELGKHLTYNDDVTFYGDLQYGTGCSISVGADYSGSEVAIYMNDMADSSGKLKLYSGVDHIDASAFNGQSTLIGSDLSDQIIGSQGNSSMWGGVGGNDSLIGTGGGNAFFYFIGDGHDEIYNAQDGDTINLSDISLEQIASAEVNSWGVKLEMTDGGTLTVNNTADVTFKLGDGSNYKANYQSREWQSA